MFSVLSGRFLASRCVLEYILVFCQAHTSLALCQTCMNRQTDRGVVRIMDSLAQFVYLGSNLWMWGDGQKNTSLIDMNLFTNEL